MIEAQEDPEEGMGIYAGLLLVVIPLGLTIWFLLYLAARCVYLLVERAID